ncbi:MAG: hypothetical protein H6Q25_585 [Bacteroidetes bacterium]|nr:hypothetical protein [Bacteroidota bacterium]
MQRIPFVKRLLYYARFSAISFLLMWLAFFLSIHNFKIFDFYIFVYLIPHYIFGLFFLKTKAIFKLIVPLVLSIISFGGLWWVSPLFFDIIETDLLFNFLFFILIICSWEMAYLILTKWLNKKSTKGVKCLDNKQINPFIRL